MIKVTKLTGDNAAALRFELDRLPMLSKLGKTYAVFDCTPAEAVAAVRAITEDYRLRGEAKNWVPSSLHAVTRKLAAQG